MKTFFFILITYVLSYSGWGQSFGAANLTMSPKPESVVQFPDGSFLVASRFSVCDTTTLNLEFFDSDGKSLWYRMYRDHTLQKPPVLLVDNLSAILLSNEKNKITSQNISLKNGKLTNSQWLGNGQLGLATVINGQLFVECQTEFGAYLIVHTITDNEHLNCIPLPQNEQKLVNLTALLNQQIFYSYGRDFGIMDSKGKFIRTWTYEELEVTEALVMPGDTSLLLGGSEMAGLFGPRNKQGYLGLLSLNDLEKVYWTQHLGSDLEDERVVGILRKYGESAISLLLYSDTGYQIYALSKEGKLKDITNTPEIGELLLRFSSQSFLPYM